jgi:prepilin-type N-terminal cleavage/methylation domain-containing protein
LARPGDRAGGFTLMELLVTMTIISMIFAMVIPNLGTFVPTARLEGSGKQILRRLDFIRSEAQIRGREMSVELDLDRAQHVAIVKRYREVNPDIPIRVVVPAAQMTRAKSLLADVEIWKGQPTVADLDGFAAEVEAVERF